MMLTEASMWCPVLPPDSIDAIHPLFNMVALQSLTASINTNLARMLMVEMGPYDTY